MVVIMGLRSSCTPLDQHHDHVYGQHISYPIKSTVASNARSMGSNNISISEIIKKSQTAITQELNRTLEKGLDLNNARHWMLAS